MRLEIGNNEHKPFEITAVATIASRPTPASYGQALFAASAEYFSTSSEGGTGVAACSYLNSRGSTVQRVINRLPTAPDAACISDTDDP